MNIYKAASKSCELWLKCFFFSSIMDSAKHLLLISLNWLLKARHLWKTQTWLVKSMNTRYKCQTVRPHHWATSLLAQQWSPAGRVPLHQCAAWGKCSSWPHKWASPGLDRFMGKSISDYYPWWLFPASMIGAVCFWIPVSGHVCGLPGASGWPLLGTRCWTRWLQHLVGLDGCTVQLQQW